MSSQIRSVPPTPSGLLSAESGRLTVEGRVGQIHSDPLCFLLGGSSWLPEESVPPPETAWARMLQVPLPNGEGAVNMGQMANGGQTWVGGSHWERRGAWGGVGSTAPHAPLCTLA